MSDAPDQFTPCHDGSMSYDPDGGWVSIDDYRVRITDLEAQRDELLDALKVGRDGLNGLIDSNDAFEMCVDAIAKCEAKP